MRAAYSALKPSECWDWIDGRDLSRISTQALRAAKAWCYPPKGEPFFDGGVPFANPRDFGETLVQLLVWHLQAEAHGKGIPGNEYAHEHLRRWYEHHGASSNNSPLPGAGRSPAIKGHGCPASASAGGPGCEPAQGVNNSLCTTPVLWIEENGL